MPDLKSIARLQELHPKIRDKALDAYNEAVRFTPVGVHPFITEAFRSFEKSDHLYALGRTIVNPDGKSKDKPMGNIVSNAKAGQSYHNYGLACFDANTRLLTPKGLKYIKDIQTTDEVLTWKDGILEYQKPLALISNDHNGEMVHIDTRSVDVLVTPNHKMVVKRKTTTRWDEEWKTIEASQIDYKYKIPTAGISSHSINELPFIKQYNIKFNIQNSEDWWEFMGYWLSEGYTAGSKDGLPKKHNGRFVVGISQSKEKNPIVWQKIYDCLTRLGLKFKFNNYHCFKIHNKGLWKHLFELGNSYTKYIPEYLLKADQSHLNKLYYALVDGDGAYYDNGESYCSVSQKLAEGFLSLSLLIGKSSSIKGRIRGYGCLLPHGEVQKSEYKTIFEVRTRTRVTQELRNGTNTFSKIKKIQYVGVVYCVSTTAGSLVIERNGKTCIVGNCDFVLLINGRESWIIDANWRAVVNIFKAHGFTSGMDFAGKFKDPPHLERTLGYNWRDLLAFHNEGKFIEGTNYVMV